MNGVVNEITIFWFACGILGAIILTIPWNKLELLFKSKSLRLCMTNRHTDSTFHRQKGIYDATVSEPCIPLIPLTSHRTLDQSAVHPNTYTFLFPSEKHKAKMQDYMGSTSHEVSCTDATDI